MNNLLGKASCIVDRSIGRILRPLSRKCQRTISAGNRRKVLKNRHLSPTVTSTETTAYRLHAKSADMRSDMNKSDRPCSTAGLRSPARPRLRRRARLRPIQAARRRRPGHRREVPHRGRRRLLVSDRRHGRRERVSSASSASQHRLQERPRPDRPALPRAAAAAAAGAEPQVPVRSTSRSTTTQTADADARTSSSTASATASACRSTRRSTGRRTEFGYEYDFVVKNRGFVGFVLEAKYTDVQVQLASPIASEFAHARGADSGDRRHRARLRRAEHLDHRRAHRLQDARQHRRAATTRTTSTSTSTAR